MVFNLRYLKYQVTICSIVLHTLGASTCLLYTAGDQWYDWYRCCHYEVVSLL